VPTDTEFIGGVRPRKSTRLFIGNEKRSHNGEPTASSFTDPRATERCIAAMEEGGRK